MKELSIGEVARRIGVQTSAIRYYERLGLLPPPKRVSGQRRYDMSVLQRLGLILLARKMGFRMRELQALFTDSADMPVSTRWQTLMSAKVAELEALIERAQTRKKWLLEAPPCQCVLIGDCAAVMFEDAGNGIKVSLSRVMG